MMMIHIKLAFGAAAAVALAATLAAGRAPPEPPVVVAANAATDESAPFDDAWRNTMMVVALEKSDMLQRAAVSTVPKSVTTVPVVPDPIVPPPVVASVPVEPQESRPAPRRQRDVCMRHGMHKVHIRNGRAWRCRR